MSKIRDDGYVSPTIKRLRQSRIKQCAEEKVYQKATAIVEKSGISEPNLGENTVMWREFCCADFDLKIRQRTRTAGDIKVSVYWRGNEVFSASSFDSRRPADVVPDYRIGLHKAIKLHTFRPGVWLSLIEALEPKKFNGLKAKVEKEKKSIAGPFTTTEFLIANAFASLIPR